MLRNDPFLLHACTTWKCLAGTGRRLFLWRGASWSGMRSGKEVSIKQTLTENSVLLVRVSRG
jgi:hypothetical protein